MISKGRKSTKLGRNGKPVYGGKKAGFHINGSSIKVIAERARYRMVYSEWFKAFIEVHGEKKYNELTIQLGFTIWCYAVRSSETPNCIKEYLTRPLTIPQISKRDGKKGDSEYKNALSNYFRSKIRDGLLKGRDLVTLFNAPNTKPETKEDWKRKIHNWAKEVNIPNFSKDTASVLHSSLQRVAKDPKRNNVVFGALSKLNESDIKLSKEEGQDLYIVNHERLMQILVYLPKVISEVYHKPDKYTGKLGKHMEDEISSLFYLIKVYDSNEQGLKFGKTIDKLNTEVGQKLVKQAKRILGLR